MKAIQVVLMLLLGLQIGNVSVSVAQDNNSTSDFLQGKVRLTCDGFFCASSAGLNLNGLANLYAKEKWQELADKIIDIGYQNDLYYFYLGRAAEELRSIESAKIYYNLAIVSEQPLNANGQPDGLCLGAACNRHVFHRDVTERLAKFEEAERLAKAAEADRLVKDAEAERLAKAAEADRLVKDAEAERLARGKRAAAKKAANAKKLNEL
jgi:hypothetical protein